MKKTLGIILSFTVAMNMACTSVWADGSSDASLPAKGKNIEVGSEDTVQKQKSLDQIIKLVRTKLKIPAEYTEFSSNVSRYGKTTSWSLQWTSRDKETSRNGGSLQVGVDEKGNITSYTHFKYNRNSEYRKRLPAISREQALEAAKKFIYYISPEMVDQIALEEGGYEQEIDYQGSYRFTFYRKYKGIPFYENSLSLTVSGDSGEVTNYLRTWMEDVQFPEADKILNLEDAKKAFQNKIGIALKYRRTYGDEKVKTYLEYSPVSADQGFSIDAITGEKVPDRSGYGISYEMSYKYTMYKREAAAYSDRIQLTEQEMDEVTRIESLMPIQELEKQAKEMTELGLSDGYTLSRYSINKNGSTGGYAARMDFVKPMSEKELRGEIPQEKIKAMMAAGDLVQTVNVTLNAKTGELLSLNAYGMFNGNSTGNTIERKELQKMAEGFLTRSKASKFSQLALQEAPENPQSIGEKYGYYNSNNGVTFVYTRNVNGLPFEDNWVVMNFDASSGVLNYYNEAWDDVEFVPGEGVIGYERAYNELFAKAGLQLKYITSAGFAGEAGQVSKDVSGTREIKLVYALNNKKPACIEARSGELIGSLNAEPFKEKNSLLFDDIHKHPAKEQIKALAEIGVLPLEKNFRPDDLILQKEFLLMISKIRGGYPAEITSGSFSQKESDALYRMLINDGLLEEEERNPDAAVTREEAVKYLLRSIGYRKFAELEGLFDCSFTDKNAIDPRLIGYVAIARSMGIVTGTSGYFQPKKEITRSDAVMMLYNYLKQ